ncbi:MAG TPA: VOC family protein [Acidimicrobiales bacterium]
MTEYEREAGAHVEKVVEIGAPVERVWEALTTPEGLRNFYCDWATVQPGEGGTIQIGWHAGALPPATIEVWEPNRRLRLVHRGAGDEAATVEEWILEGLGGSTVVRLVYEGFGPGDDWDDFYDSFDATASLVVDLLATWLERHGGRPLTKLAVTTPTGLSRDDLWETVLGPAFAGAGGAAGGVGTGGAGGAAGAVPAPGTPVTVPLPGGEPLAGTVVHVAPGNEAAVELPDYDGARLVVCVRPGADTPSRLIAEIYTYGLPEATTDALQRRLDAAADALSPTRSTDMSNETPSNPAPSGAAAPDTGRYQPADSHTVVPYLAAHDAAAAIDFYVDVLGAREQGERFVGPDGKVGHAELKIGDSFVYLSDEFPEMGVLSPKSLGGTASSLVVYVPDVDEAVTRAVRAGATIERGIEETFYGTRRATMIDPFGHRWLIGTHVRDVSEGEYRAAVERYRTGDDA